MVCTACRTPNFRDYRFCRECGTALEMTAVVPVGDQGEVVEQLIEHALVQMERGDLEKAVGTLHAALARDPENPSAHSTLGLVYERQGMIADAIHQFRVVLQLSPDSTADRDRLQQLLARGGRDGKAPRLTPFRLAVGSAIAAGAVTFAVGLSLMNAGTTRAQARGGNGAVLPTAALGTARVAPVPAAAPKAEAPTPLQQATRQQPAPVRPFGNLPSPAYAFQPVPGHRPEVYQPTPPAPIRHQPAGMGSGLQAVRIGEVVPLTRPDLPAGPLTSAAGPAPQTRPQPKPTVEPLEPDTGFIKIEPIEKPPSPSAAAPGAGPTAAAADSGKPSISITISPGSR